MGQTLCSTTVITLRAVAHGAAEHNNTRARESVQAFHASFCHFGFFFTLPLQLSSLDSAQTI